MRTSFLLTDITLRTDAVLPLIVLIVILVFVLITVRRFYDKLFKGRYKIIHILITIVIVIIVIFAPKIFKSKSNDTVEETQNSNSSPAPTKNNNIVINVNDVDAVNNYLLSKTTFRNEDVVIKFYPGYYEVTKNYQEAFSGKWTIGQRRYDSSIMINLESEIGDTQMMLSTDGKIMDKGTLKIFQ